MTDRRKSATRAVSTVPKPRADRATGRIVAVRRTWIMVAARIRPLYGHQLKAPAASDLLDEPPVQTLVSAAAAVGVAVYWAWQGTAIEQALLIGGFIGASVGYLAQDFPRLAFAIMGGAGVVLGSAGLVFSVMVISPQGNETIGMMFRIVGTAAALFVVIVPCLPAGAIFFAVRRLSAGFVAAGLLTWIGTLILFFSGALHG